jgi:hypothetical protein
MFNSKKPKQPVPVRIAARWLKVPVSWLTQQAREGRIPAIIAGRTILVEVALVEQAMRDQLAKGVKHGQ